MKKTDLGGAWQMKRTDWNSFIAAKVPGSICTDLMNSNFLPDPYFRNNSDLFEEAAEYDYIYERDFSLEKSDLNHKNINLCCDGLDTLCEIKINGKTLASTDNMHRSYRFDIKDFVSEGKNKISVLIKSPTKFCRMKHSEMPLAQVPDEQCRKGFSHLRKAHCMLGWDWGPIIPDGGIWRDIYISYDNGLRIESVFITQEHMEDKKVFINVLPEIKCDKDVKCKVKFDGKVYEFTGEKLRFEVEAPKLWYPAGYGEHYLYDFKLIAESGDEEDTYNCRIGLRDAKVVCEKDQFGTSMYFSVNGIPVFAKGANYIIEDSIITRCTPERTRDLLNQAVESNNNTVRVWGGAIYPFDYFYDICDELGLLVWQDFMFACAQYPDTKEFYDNISAEAEDNIKRLRNHPSLIMWCGNNECETAVHDWWKLDKKDLDAYLYQFNTLLRGIAKKFDPTRFYMPSSPTGTGDFEDINTENIGDAHYWEIWFNQKPLSEYMKYHFRFLSEFGFQSFPALETVETFTEEKDRNIFSRVMEHHQRSGAANGLILSYLAREYRYTKDFDSLIYVSQLMQADAIRVGVEHARRNRNGNRCMGTIYWQLNDCWQVASWAGIDYFGRWKALQYSAKKFFAPILVSALHYEENKALISYTNDTLEKIGGTVYYSVKKRSGEEVLRKEIFAEVAPLSSVTVFDFETDGIDIYNEYIEFGLNGEQAGIMLLCPSKHFEYENPEIEYKTEIKDGKTHIILSCKSLANYIELKADNGDVKFSDNYFALSAGTEKEIICSKTIDKLSIRSLIDTY